MSYAYRAMNAIRKKVLVFEDNSDLQTLLKFFFQKHGIDARLASDGTDAVPLALAFRPDLILMDYIMPGKDGIEAVIDLRRAGISVPIVMLTSKSFPEDQERARVAGVTTYLMKPFDPNRLVAVIAPHLGA